MAASALLAISDTCFRSGLGFRGGKGVATALGSFLRFNPLAVLFAVIVFLMVVAVSRRVSLGSIVTAALFPVAVWFLGPTRDGLVIALLSVASALIIARHHENIRRLLSGDEPRLSLGSK